MGVHFRVVARSPHRQSRRHWTDAAAHNDEFRLCEPTWPARLQQRKVRIWPDRDDRRARLDACVEQIDRRIDWSRPGGNSPAPVIMLIAHARRDTRGFDAVL